MTEKEICQLAIGICIELGLDPDETVECGALDIATPIEERAFDGRVPAVAYRVPRWRLYRGKAAEAFAIRKALEA